MIVAACARSRESLKCFRDDIDLAVHGLDLFVERVHRIEAVLDEPEVAIPLAWEHFDTDGRLTNEETQAALECLLGGLADLARTRTATQAA